MRLFAADNERANSDEAGDGDESGVAVLRRLVPGSIAEREYMKWYNAVEMPNNPYAPEALRKRITSGSQERFIDLPNISPTCGQTPVRLMQKDDLAANEANRENDYKRYRRDYYINDDGRQAASSSSDGHHHHPKPADDSNSAPNNSNSSNSNNNSNIIINEVKKNSLGNEASSSACGRQRRDYRWTLSTPVRRSSSLKFIDNRLAPLASHAASGACSAPFRSPSLAPPHPRPFTSASQYAPFNGISSDDEDDRENDVDARTDTDAGAGAGAGSGAGADGGDEDGAAAVAGGDDRVELAASDRSWKNVAALPKRRTQSLLSVYSGSSTGSRRGRLSASVLSQFEKQLLHKDLKRNSFRAISATTKDFVMNPLYDREKFFKASSSKLSALETADDQVDSGVDSCLNGFTELDNGKRQTTDNASSF